MGQLKKPTPLEYSKLSWTQKTYYITAWFLDRCTEEPLFSNGRPSKAFGQVRGYFTYKVPPKELQCLYDAVYSLETKTLTSIFDIWLLAEKVRMEQRMQSGKPEETVEQYPNLMSYL